MGDLIKAVEGELFEEEGWALEYYEDLLSTRHPLLLGEIERAYGRALVKWIRKGGEAPPRGEPRGSPLPNDLERLDSLRGSILEEGSLPAKIRLGVALSQSLESFWSLERFELLTFAAFSAVLLSLGRDFVESREWYRRVRDQAHLLTLRGEVSWAPTRDSARDRLEILERRIGK